MVTEPVAAHELSDVELEAAIGSGAARIASLQCRFLLLAVEVDRRRLWARWGMRSAAAWLSWRCGLDEVTAREQLRVGRALEGLPAVREAFAAGRLSYSKVRALTRVATPEDEQGWVDTAVGLPAHQLNDLTRAYRKATAAADHRANAYVRWSWVDDGSLVLAARLAPEQGALVLAALRQADDVLREVAEPNDVAVAPVDSADAPTTVPVDSVAAQAGTSQGPERPTLPDALTLVAHASLAAGPRATAGTEPYQVVLHLAADRQHLHAGPAVDDATARRLSCDATITALVHGEGRQVRSVGRRMRRIPPIVRRALEERDGGCCTHPGCSHRRFLQAHHVVHWADGGPTDPDNLVLLCSFHHAALHAGLFSVDASGDGRFVFCRADGLPMQEAPEMADLPPSPTRHRLFSEHDPAPDVIAGTWDGDRLDRDWVVAVFAHNRALRERAVAA